jgi:hypothetical protein
MDEVRRQLYALVDELVGELPGIPAKGNAVSQRMLGFNVEAGNIAWRWNKARRVELGVSDDGE